MGRFSNEKIWVMDRHTLEYWQHAAGQRKKVAYYFRLKKHLRLVMVKYVFSLEDAVAHLSATDSSSILTIDK